MPHFVMNTVPKSYIELRSRRTPKNNKIKQVVNRKQIIHVTFTYIFTHKLTWCKAIISSTQNRIRSRCWQLNSVPARTLV